MLDREMVLPNILKHPKVLRDDVQLIDHVSLLLDKESVLELKRILNENGIETDFVYIKADKEYTREIGITVAYSENRIHCYPFSKEDCELETFYRDLSKPLYIQVKDLVGEEITTIKGEKIECLSIKERKLFNQMHQFYINKGAVWNQGEYIPFIKVKHPDDQTQLEKILNIDLSQYKEKLKITAIRYMRFGELRQ